MKVINGDPLTFEQKKNHLQIYWYDRILNDQLESYTDWSEKNEHANASKGWAEYLEQITDKEQEADLELRWWEYKGKSVRDNLPAPLVICFHEYYNTCWQHIADAEGLIIVAFEYHRNARPPEGGLGALGYGSREDEIITYNIVINRVIEKFNIDKQKIYLNGLSYGDGTALNYIMKYGDSIAAVVLMNGPSSPYNCTRLGFDKLPNLPSMQLRSEDDLTCDGFPDGMSFDCKGNYEWLRNIRSRSTVYNRNLWLKANDIKGLPKIYSRGKYVFLIYESEKGDVIYNENAERCHIPPIDYAQIMWDMLYSRYKRNDNGEIELIGEKLPADKDAVAMVVGSKNIYTDNMLVSLDAPLYKVDPIPDLLRDHRVYAKTEVSYSSIYAPLDVLSKAFGIEYKMNEVYNYSDWSEENPPEDFPVLDDSIIEFRYREDDFKIYTNTNIVKKNNKILDLERPPLVIKGGMMIPVKEVAELLGFNVSERNDSLYITKHKVQIGYSFSRILREEILAETKPELKYLVSVICPRNGEISVSKEVVDEGETIELRAVPDDGFVTDEAVAYMNGLEVPVNRITDDLYYVCNALSDVVIEVKFIEAGG